MGRFKVGFTHAPSAHHLQPAYRHGAIEGKHLTYRHGAIEGEVQQAQHMKSVSLTNGERKSTYILLIVMGRLKAGLSKCRVCLLADQWRGHERLHPTYRHGAIESGIE